MKRYCKSGEAITMTEVTQAIAAFERAQVSGGSPFDRWYFGGEEDALTDAQKRGFDRFVNKGRCVMGEHDYYLDLGEYWSELFGPQYYSWDHKGVHFVTLNSILAYDAWTHERWPSDDPRLLAMEAHATYERRGVALEPGKH